MKRKRFMLSFLLICLVFSIPFVFFSCKNSGGTDNNDSAGKTDASENTAREETTVNPIEALNPNITQKNFGGYEFKILSTDDGNHAYPLHSRDIIAETETGDPINDATYRRNTEVEEKYNIKIKMISIPENNYGDLYTLVKNSVSAGDNAYDLVFAHIDPASRMAADGYLFNWNNIPYVDLTEPWWFQGAVKGLSVGDKLFLSLSDLSISTAQYTYMMFFNKEIQKQFNAEDLYGLVKSGKWTFDKVSEVTKGITADINGDGIMDNEDRYGAIVSYSALEFFYAGGNTYMAKDADNYPYINILTERAVNTFDKAYDICHSDYVRFEGDWQTESQMDKMFMENKAFLYFKNLNSIQYLKEMNSDFGIIPYPKLDESQDKYYTYVDGHSPLLGIPKTTDDIERTGAIIEDLSYLSYKYNRPAFYDVTLKTKFTRDEESVEMLDTILDGIVYDFGYVYDLGNAYIFQNQINGKKREFSSAVEKVLNAAQKKLEKIIAQYDAAE